MRGDMHADMCSTCVFALCADVCVDVRGECMQVVETAIRFISLSGRRVPWGSQERAGETTFFIAAHRNEGSANVFNSWSLDDVHDRNMIRLAHPYRSNTDFPSVEPADFLHALRGQTPAERKINDFDMSEEQLQKLAAANPVATSVIFNRNVNNYHKNIICNDSKRMVNVPLDERQKGMYVRMCVCTSAWKHVCMYVHMRVEMYVCP